jgi:hypothetical protein
MSERTSLGDLFRAEFQDIIDVGSRVSARRPRVPIARTSFSWAVLAGVGAGFFASAIVRVAASLLLSSQRTSALQPPTAAELAMIAGSALAIAIAFRAGGWLATAGYLATVAVERLLGLPALLQTCANPDFARAPVFADRCTVGGQLLPLWPIAVGCALAFVLVRIFRRSHATTNGALESAGALALALAIFSPLAGLVLFTEPLAARTNPDGATVAAFAVAQAAIGGIAAGFVLARRSRWPWRGFAAIALVVLIGYLWFSVPSLIRAFATSDLGGLGTGAVIGFGAPLFEIATVAIALALTSATSPRAPALG